MSERETNILFWRSFSIDRAYRTLNKSYWEEEIPSEEDYKNGNKNLKACDYKVDYVITHTCPLNLIPSLGGISLGDGRTAIAELSAVCK